MLVIPHSFPHLTEHDKSSVMNCFDVEYIGYDDKVAKEIEKSLRNYLTYSFITLALSASLSLLLIFKYLKVGLGDQIIMSAVNCWAVYNCITLAKKNVELDIRKSVQPNLTKELNIKSNINSYDFKEYYSLPLNSNAYEILNSKGLLSKN